MTGRPVVTSTSSPPSFRMAHSAPSPDRRQKMGSTSTTMPFGVRRATVSGVRPVSSSRAAWFFLVLARATARMQPPSDKGRRLKIFYLTQASTRPPTFVAFVNAKHLFHFSYQRYIINQIRENFGLAVLRMEIFLDLLHL